jgi:hypothetical protein
VEIVILDSAYKHGVSYESIRFCIFNVRGAKILEDHPPKRLVAGFDQQGTALEVIAVEDEERDRLIVIHAMKLRKQFYYLLGGNYGL